MSNFVFLEAISQGALAERIDKPFKAQHNFQGTLGQNFDLKKKKGSLEKILMSAASISW